MTFEAGWNAAIEKAAEIATAEMESQARMRDMAEGERDEDSRNAYNHAVHISSQILTAIRSLTLPSDLVAVPREPTPEMVKAAVEADDKRTGAETCKHIYRAMLAAHKEG